MNKISCEVIRDLLPLYVDKVCSQDSEKLVKEHMGKCKECRMAAERMTMIEFEVQERNLKEIDYLKKLKHYMQKKILFVCVALILLIVMFAWSESRYSQMPLWIYYILLPMISVICYVVCSDYMVNCKRNNWKDGMIAMNVLVLVYLVGAAWAMIQWVKSGNYPLDWSAERVGPFMNSQFVGIAVICAVMLIAAVNKSVKTGISTSVLQTMSITGCCMAMAFITWLRRLDTLEASIAIRNTIIGVMMLEGIVLSLIFWVLDKRKERMR